MRRFVGFLTAGVLATLAVSADAVTISGRVVDLGHNRSGIPAVEIKLQTYGENATEASTYTDAKGRFTITGIPRVPRAKLTAARKGWQNYPTTLLISTEREHTSDVLMVAEGGSAAYYRAFASEIAKTDLSERRALRAIWFSLPASDAAVVKQEFAALGGDPEQEHILYIAEATTTSSTTIMTSNTSPATRTRLRKD